MTKAWGPTAFVDLGGGFVLWWDVDGRGFAWKHPGCRSWFELRLWPDPASTGHRLVAGGYESDERVTVAGSLLCPKGCGAHGHIVDGAWQSC